MSEKSKETKRRLRDIRFRIKFLKEEMAHTRDQIAEIVKEREEL